MGIVFHLPSGETVFDRKGNRELTVWKLCVNFVCLMFRMGKYFKYREIY